MKVKDIPVGAWVYSGDRATLPDRYRYYSYRPGTFEKINEQNEFRYLNNYTACFDYPETNAPHINLQKRGSNCYYDSDLRLWLNSSGPNWRKPKNEYESDSDVEQGYRRVHAFTNGFMTDISEPFLNSLCSIEIDCDITERDKIKLHGKSKKCYDLFTIEPYKEEAHDGYRYWGKVLTRTPGEAGYIKLTSGKNMAANGHANVYPICKMNDSAELEFIDISNEVRYNGPPDKRLYFPIEKYGEIPDIEIFNIL